MLPQVLPRILRKGVGLGFLVIAFGAWPGSSLTDLGKSVLESSGVVTSSQADALLKAGGKLNQASKSLNDEQEYYLGRAVSALILRQYPLYKGNPGLTHYLNVLGSVLASNSSRPEIFGGYHFAILDSDEINALSAPGGFVFVSRGLLKIIPDEEALAGVLAHELGHIILGHGVKAISEAKVSEALLIVGSEAASSYGPKEITALTDAFNDSVNKVFETLMKNGYGRSQEYDADDFAAKLMAKTGYSVQGLTVMLDRLGQAGGAKRGGLMDTHPAPSDRKSSLKLPKQTIASDATKVREARFSSHVVG